MEIMQNKKVVGIGVGIGLLIIFLGGSLWFVLNRDNEPVSYGAATGRLSSATPTQPQAGSSGLGVAVSPGARDLGQLSVGGQSGAPSGAQGSAQGSASPSGASSGQGIDPASFGEYDKYKESPNALFGDIKAGDGKQLGANQKATVLYKGWLTNGQVFDQSRTGSDGNMEPFSFTVGAGQVIKGWEEGLFGMKVGGTRLVIVPPSVGYGAQGQGGVPPNAVMVFAVQLLAVD